jgi:hypothetical protein
MVISITHLIITQQDAPHPPYPLRYRATHCVCVCARARVCVCERLNGYKKKVKFDQEKNK